MLPSSEKDMDEARAAKVDGSGRRVVATSSGWLAGLGTAVKDLKEMVSETVA